MMKHIQYGMVRHTKTLILRNGTEITQKQRETSKMNSWSFIIEPFYPLILNWSYLFQFINIDIILII